MSESIIQSMMRLQLGSDPDVRIFRNLVGVGFVGNPQRGDLRRVTFGLAVGSADLIGITRYVIQPDDVGKVVGIFTSVEVKAASNSAIREQQEPWRKMIDLRGGISLISHLPSEALYIIKSWRPKHGNEKPT